MHRAERSHHRPIFYGHVTRERGAVYQHGMISDGAVVPDVRVRHNQRMTADLSDASAFRCAAINGHIFADGVVIAYF